MPDSDSDGTSEDGHVAPVGWSGLVFLAIVTGTLVAGTTDLVPVVGAVNLAIGWTGVTAPGVSVTTLPVEVYGFAVIGGTLRLVYDVSRDEDEVLEDLSVSDQDVPEEAFQGTDRRDVLYELVFVQQLLAILAGVCLAAGIALVNDVTVDVLLNVGSVPSYFAALFAGLYIKETYLSLGNVTERFLVPDGNDESATDGPDGDDATAEQPSSRMALSRLLDPPENDESSDGVRRVVIAVSFPTVLAVTVAVGIVLDVPLDVPVYAFFGGLGYVYTALFVNAEENATEHSRVKYGLRLLLGVLLAMVGHVLLAPTTRAVAAVAFLIGLFPNVILERIEGLSRQVFGRLRNLDQQ